MKRLVSGFLVLAVMLCGTRAYAAQITGETAQIDYINEKITVSGSYNGAKSDRVSMVVYHSADFSEDSMVYAAQLRCNENGKFVYTFRLREEDTVYESTYYISFGGKGVAVSDIKTTSFILINPQRIDEILNELNAADGNTVYSVIEANNHIFGIDLLPEGEYAQLSAEKQQQILNMFAAKRIEKIGDVSAVFEKMILERKALDEIAISENIETFDEVIRRYADILTPDLSRYDMLEDKTPMTACIKGYEFTEDFLKEFSDCVDLEYIRQAGWWDLEERISSLSDKMENDLKEALKNVDEEDFPAVFKRLADTEISALDEVIPELEKIAAKYPKNNTDRTNNNGGSSGGDSRRSSGGEDRITAASPQTTDEKPASLLPISDAELQDKSYSFGDIAEITWAADAIEDLHQRGILSDSESGEYRPNQPVLREEFLKMLVEALQIPETENEVSFDDTAADGWYMPYLRRAWDAGIVTGLDDHTFGIGTPITRQDTAVLLRRAAKVRKLVLPENQSVEFFKDMNAVSDYAVDGVMFMKNTGIMNGVGDNLFAPKEKISRAMAAKVIHNIFSLLETGALE